MPLTPPYLPDPPPPPRTQPEPTHIFIRVGVLRLGGVGDGSVTIRTVVFAVIVRCPVVRDEEQLLNVTLGKEESP